MESWNKTLDRQHYETLKKIYIEPCPSNLPWADIQSLLEELTKANKVGGCFNTASGARVRIKLDNMVRGDVYQPYPPNGPTPCPLIRSVRDLLAQAKIEP